ncbi:MAG: hydroxyethylthiazole kinase [Clostridiaceae bacterium]|nr:hydroxyethylthiazole kinase [Clostridiaceae bacterium]
MVHSITNNVTINDCANIILAAGGTAIMAQDEREVEEITANSDALALNMGALRAQEAMLLAAREAKRLGHPVVLDPVAAGASRLRSEMCSRLLVDGLVSVIRGNASEIRALAAGEEHAAGVEASVLDRVTEENLTESAAWLAAFSRKTSTVVLLSGAIDLITDGTRTAALRGGSALMSRITGAGCMLTSLTAAYCGTNPNTLFEAAVTASGVMKVCGTLAERRVREEMEGTASFRTRLIDAVSLLTTEQLAEGLRIQLL